MWLINFTLKKEWSKKIYCTVLLFEGPINIKKYILAQYYHYYYYYYYYNTIYTRTQLYWRLEIWEILSNISSINKYSSI